MFFNITYVSQHRNLRFQKKIVTTKDRAILVKSFSIHSMYKVIDNVQLE